MGEDDYSRGMRDGELKALASAVGRAHERLDLHERRLAVQERITYALLGMVALVQVAPSLIALGRVLQNQ